METTETTESKFTPEVKTNLNCLTTFLDNGGMGIYNQCDRCMIAIIRYGSENREYSVQSHQSIRVWLDGFYQLIGERPC